MMVRARFGCTPTCVDEFVPQPMDDERGWLVVSLQGRFAYELGHPTRASDVGRYDVESILSDNFRPLRLVPKF